MYRIITSTTKEEHFESPSAAAFGMMTYCGNTVPNSSSTVNSVSVQPLKITARSSTNPGKNSADSSYYWGDYDVYGDLYVHGNIYARNIDNTIIDENEDYRRYIVPFDTDPKTNVWEGQPGQMGFTANYAYLCVGGNTWVRMGIQSSW